MRRAAIVAMVGVLLTMAGAAFTGGMSLVSFIRQQTAEANVALDDVITASMSAHAWVGVAMLAVGLVAAIVGARVLLLGLRVRNPERVLAGPAILTVAAAVISAGLAVPYLFLAVACGLAWGMIRVWDELGIRVGAPKTSFTGYAKNPTTTGGDVGDWS